jgi:hypothetical protein
MKTALRLAAVLIGLSGAALAEPPADVHAAPSCKHCGMDREKFAHSRMLVEYEDGGSVGLCSAHCAAIELSVAIDRTPKTIRVADHGTKALVDAEAAVWVIGGGLPGVMTARAKWAFADRAAAEAFVKANGGKLATFDEAMRATYEDMYQDSKTIRERRKMMRARQHGHATPAAHEQPAPAKP